MLQIVNLYISKNTRENMDMTDYKIETGRGCIYNGQAGSGKKTKLCEWYKKQKTLLSWHLRIKR